MGGHGQKIWKAKGLWTVLRKLPELCLQNETFTDLMNSLCSNYLLWLCIGRNFLLTREKEHPSKSLHSLGFRMNNIELEIH